MLHPARSAALLALCLLCACATAREPKAVEETVVVSRKPGGLHSRDTPNFEVTVRPNGAVVLRTHHGLSPGADFFQLSPAKAARLTATLLPYRPAEGDPLGSPRLLKDGDVICRGAIYEIRWESTTLARTLTLCGGHLDALDQALELIGLTRDGDRRRPPQP
jgi:hypothetical protein